MSTPTRLSPPKLILATLSLVVWPALVLFLARDWRWPEGWIFGGWFLAMCASTMAWLYREDPALLAERYRKPGSGGQSRRDKPNRLVLAHARHPLGRRAREECLKPKMRSTQECQDGLVSMGLLRHASYQVINPREE